VLAPLVINFSLTKLACLLFHALLLLTSLLLKVKVFKADVFIIHQLALLPLLQALGVILCLVASQTVLKATDLLKSELVETELEVYKVVIDFKEFQPSLSAVAVHLAVGHVKAQ